jgi:hypothetical protein
MESEMKNRLIATLFASGLAILAVRHAVAAIVAHFHDCRSAWDIATRAVLA